MDIDVSVLRAIEREREIPFDVLVDAIEQALLLAYQRTEGAQPHARAQLDRKSGHVMIWAQELGEEGELLREWEDTPTGFGRLAAATARQVIFQRLRDVEDEQAFGEFTGKEGELISGIIQQGRDPRIVHVDLGKVEGVLPPAEQVPGEKYIHGERLRCYVLQVRKGMRGPQITLSRTHANLVRKLFALEVPGDRRRLGRDHGRRPGGRSPVEDRRAVERPGHQPEGRLHRPDGQPRPQRHARAARREDRHRRLVRRPGRERRERAVAGPGEAASRSSTWPPGRPA